jgi:hypothetical protein
MCGCVDVWMCGWGAEGVYSNTAGGGVMLCCVALRGVVMVAERAGVRFPAGRAMVTLSSGWRVGGWEIAGN